LEFQKQKEREKGAESLFKEMITESFPNMGRHLDIQVHKAHRSPNQLNLKRSSPRYIIIKLLKIKDKKIILKVARKRL